MSSTQTRRAIETALDAYEAILADGLNFIHIEICKWAPPRILVVGVPHLADLPGACCTGPTPDGGEEWQADYHGARLVWFRDVGQYPRRLVKGAQS